MSGRVIQGYFIGGGIRPQRAVVPGTGRPGLAGRTATAQARPVPGRLAPPLQPPGAAQPYGGGDSFEIDPVQVGLVRGAGMPLPQTVLAKMEAAFGANFSAVRIHVGPQAPRIGALAFTMGNDIYFAPGRYQPETVQGQQLLGHELAHVVQQRQGRVRATGTGISVVQDRALEAEADRLGRKVAMQLAPIGARPASPCRHPMGTPGRPGAFRAAQFRAVQRAAVAVPQNMATESSQATYLTATNSTNGALLCENLQSAGGAHSEDRLIDEILPAAAAGGHLVAGVNNVIFVGINRSPCTSTDHLGNGSPSCNKGMGHLGCAERLINLVTTGVNHGGNNYPIQLVLEVRNLYGSNDAERGNSAEAIQAMVNTGRITCDQQRTATSTRYLNTGAAKLL